jgi:hypothetical protein
MFDRIDALITKHGFQFQAWDDRYSKGVWAALGVFHASVDAVRDTSQAGDCDMIPAMDYVFSADWMPCVTGRTLTEAMTNLETRLAALPAEQLSRDSDWSWAVSRALENLRDAWNTSSGYGDIEGTLQPLPANFSEYAKAD